MGEFESKNDLIDHFRKRVPVPDKEVVWLWYHKIKNVHRVYSTNETLELERNYNFHNTFWITFHNTSKGKITKKVVFGWLCKACSFIEPSIINPFDNKKCKRCSTARHDNYTHGIVGTVNKKHQLIRQIFGDLNPDSMLEYLIPRTFDGDATQTVFALMEDARIRNNDAGKGMIIELEDWHNILDSQK